MSVKLTKSMLPLFSVAFVVSLTSFPSRSTAHPVSELAYPNSTLFSGQAASFSETDTLLKYASTDTVPTLALGSVGQPVADIQVFLQQSGLYTGSIDGVYGIESRTAVLEFQELAGLSPDGTVGLQTWRAMINVQVSS